MNARADQIRRDALAQGQSREVADILAARADKPGPMQNNVPDASTGDRMARLVRLFAAPAALAGEFIAAGLTVRHAAYLLMNATSGRALDAPALANVRIAILAARRSKA